MQEGFPSAREGRSGDVSHQNIYDSDDDIIEPHEDTSDNIEHNFYGDDSSMDINDEDDSREVGGQSGSAEELNRFELKPSERLPQPEEKDDDEDDKEDETPKPYNTHDYINNIEDHNNMMSRA